MTQTTKTLTHGQKAFIAAWGREEFFTIGSIEGFAASGSWQTVEQAVKSAIKNGHELAWTSKPGHAITSDKGYYERLKAEQASAIELTPGETVVIEGREYTVKPIGARYSDPVYFIAKREAA